MWIFFSFLLDPGHPRCFVRFKARALLDEKYRQTDSTASLLYPQDHKVPLRIAVAGCWLLVAGCCCWLLAAFVLSSPFKRGLLPIPVLLSFPLSFLSAPVISPSDNVIHPQTPFPSVTLLPAGFNDSPCQSRSLTHHL